MAEAHNAAALSFSVSHDGVSLSYDQELLRDIWHAFTSAYKRRVARFKNDFMAGIFPANPRTLIFMITLVFGLALVRIDVTLGFIPFIKRMINYCCVSEGYFVTIFSTLFASLVFWFLTIQALRLSLKMILSYHGYMYEEIGKPYSWQSMAFYKFVSTLKKCAPLMHSFQGALPHLPLPSLEGTLKRHLKSMRPILNDKEYKELEELTVIFQKGIGRRLQRYLVIKSWLSVNWVSDWWEEFVYLRGRSPIMVSSNYYGLDPLKPPTGGQDCVPKQSARAAALTVSALCFRRTIERAEVSPFAVGGPRGFVPFCTQQYEKLYNCTRIPGEETDVHQVTVSSRHVAVLHKGRWFRLRIHTGKRLANAAELQLAYEQILQDTSLPAAGEEDLAAMTAGDRTPWACARRDYFSRGLNKTSLHCIEKAAFVVVLDDFEVHYDEKDSSKLDYWAHMALHGHCNDRWFDKSFTLCISKNSRMSCNFEHSWGDAAVAAHFLEDVLKRDIEESNYDVDGNCPGVVEVRLDPQRLTWEIPPECQAVIASQLSVARALVSDVEMRILVWTEYGKGFMKKLKCSPDAFIQMALQLTYFKDQASFCLTYEASMTRLFREGRTETVRSCSEDSAAFCRAMCDPESSADKRCALLRIACDNHQSLYRDAMTGKGIDRHLFGLYVVKRYLEEESPFLDKIFPPTYLLSTSQSPLQQTGADFSKRPDLASAGGGFGPVAEKGYGVSYVVAGEDLISFHISSKFSAPNTSSVRFRELLVQNLRDMRELLKTNAPPSVPTTPIRKAVDTTEVNGDTKKDA